MNSHPENEPFARLIASLEPWLANVVIIGGWAYRLYRLHPNAQQVTYLPLMTLDTDVAVPPRLPVTGQDIRERLMSNGFEEERLGQDKPPATLYRLGDAKTGFYAEFLTPLFGAQHGRDGKPKGNAANSRSGFKATPPSRNPTSRPLNGCHRPLEWISVCRA
jgi:hypothetical protein